MPQPTISPREKLLASAKTFIGKDASPGDIAPDDVGCAESCSMVINETFGDFPYTVGTADLHQKLLKHPKFKGTLKLDPGNVIISPTGRGNGSIPGHVGIIAEKDVIMSNNSATGLWDTHHTISSWIKRYRIKGGFPIFVFERVA